MPKKRTIDRVRKLKRQGKSPSTQAGEFVREEIEHIREGKHGARSTKQAIAIALSKARRSGVKLPPPENGDKEVREKAVQDLKAAKKRRKPDPKRSRAVLQALKRQKKRSVVSKKALSRRARLASKRRKKKRAKKN